MANEEEKIYQKDLIHIKRKKKIAPHTLEVLCLWAVMTRLKQAEVGLYDKKYHDLLIRLSPYLKALLYNGDSLQPHLSPQEETSLKEIVIDCGKNHKGPNL